MSKEIKSGKEILDDFFDGIKSDTDLDKATVEAVIDLYVSDKLTDKKLTNALRELRESKDNGENK